MLVFFVLGDANFSRHLTQNPQRETVEYRFCGLQTQNSCVGHVHFMLFVSISFAFGGQRKHSFQWNMGLSLCSLLKKSGLDDFNLNFPFELRYFSGNSSCQTVKMFNFISRQNS